VSPVCCWQLGLLAPAGRTVALVLQRRRRARAKARRRRRRARQGRCSGIGVLAEGAVVACPRETKRGLAWGEQAGGGKGGGGG